MSAVEGSYTEAEVDEMLAAHGKNGVTHSDLSLPSCGVLGTPYIRVSSTSI